MDGLAVHDLVARVDLLVPRFQRVIVKDRHPALGEAEGVEVAGELRGGFARREVAAHLEFHGVTELPELHAEVKSLRAERHLARDASAAVHDALEVAHPHEMRRRLVGAVHLAVCAAVLAPDPLEFRHQGGHVERTVGLQPERRTVIVVEALYWSPKVTVPLSTDQCENLYPVAGVALIAQVVTT